MGKIRENFAHSDTVDAVESVNEGKNVISVDEFINMTTGGHTNLNISVDENILPVTVKRHIPIDEYYAGVNAVVNGCFDGDTYRAWCHNMVLAIVVVGLFTDLKLPDDINKKYEFLMLSGAYEKIVGCIDENLLNEFVSSVAMEIEERKREISDSRKRDLDSAIDIIKNIAVGFGGLNEFANEFMNGDMRELSDALKGTAKFITDKAESVEHHI